MASERRTLASWKEIAETLGVTVRTVQRWERESGLPVHRQGHGPKARVFAYADEVLAWREAEPARAALPAPGEPPPPISLRHLTPAFLLGAAVVLAALWGVGFLARRPAPATWTFHSSTLSVLDGEGRALWQKPFPDADPDMRDVRDRVLIEDVDADGRVEVLFNFFAPDRANVHSALYCFNHDGSQRWKFTYGAVMSFAGRRFGPSYTGRFLRHVRSANRDFILTVAQHHLWYPAQVALVDPRSGRALEQYWHPGSFESCLVRDVDGDQRLEVALGGVNNPGDGMGHPALAVLSIPFSDAPPDGRKPDPRFPAPTGGGEKYYLLFPRADVSQALGDLPRIASLSVDPESRLVATSALPEAAGIVYALDRGLKVSDCRMADPLAPLHARLHRLGVLDHELGPDETRSLCSVFAFSAAPDANSIEIERLWASPSRSRLVRQETTIALFR